MNRLKRTSLRRLKKRFLSGKPLTLESIQDTPKMDRYVIRIGFRVALHGSYVTRVPEYLSSEDRSDPHTFCVYEDRRCEQCETRARIAGLRRQQLSREQIIDVSKQAAAKVAAPQMQYDAHVQAFSWHQYCWMVCRTAGA